MNIHIASDHAGFEMKELLKKYLIETGHTVTDHGAFTYDALDDYPDFIIPCATAVVHTRDSFGIILGGSGQGEQITANKIDGIRAIEYYGGNLDIIKLGREHNDANILSIGARFVTNDESIQAVQVFLDTSFSGDERHIQRIEKIEQKQFGKYQKWHILKSEINTTKKVPEFTEGQIWNISLGSNIGFEQDGKGDSYYRPVIVLKKFNKNIFLGIPLTHTTKDLPFYFHFNFQNEKSAGILSQIRLLDGKRFGNLLGSLSVKDYQQLKEKTKQLLFG